MKRVLIVDDSTFYRKILATTISHIPNVRLSGQARDGVEAIEKAALLKPDIITLDVEMPRMNGLETLKEIHKRWPEIMVVMVSAHTRQGARETIEALENGAFSFVTKPSRDSFDEFANQLDKIFNEINYNQSKKLPKKSTGAIGPTTIIRATKPGTGTFAKPKVICIGVSTGGPNSLSKVIPLLPATLPVPVLLVQHMPKGFTSALAASLDAKSKVRVKEGEHGEVLKAGVVYIAPGGQQMKVVKNDGNVSIVLSEDPPENYCRPSVDFLFRSVSQVYRDNILAVIMTGMGSDGTLGLKRIKRFKAKTIGQNAESCVVYGMPHEAKKAGVIDVEVPLEAIVSEINRSF